MDWPYVFEVIDSLFGMFFALMILLLGIFVYRIDKRLKSMALRIEWMMSASRAEILNAIPQKKKRGRPKRKNPA